jgi:hypothetical protein
LFGDNRVQGSQGANDLANRSAGDGLVAKVIQGLTQRHEQRNQDYRQHQGAPPKLANVTKRPGQPGLYQHLVGPVRRGPLQHGATSAESNT